MAGSEAVVETIAPRVNTPLATRSRIVAFVTDDISAAALRTGLDDAAVEVKRGDVYGAVRLLQNDTELHAIIVDLAEISDPIAALEDLQRVCPADVAVVLIGDGSDLGFYRTLLEMGVREYLPKPLTRDAVQTLLRPKLIADGEALDPSERGGHVVTICGAQGGAGATSIAVNLALQLADTTKARVALLDLHLQGGKAAVMLGLRPGPGLRIALEDPMRADALFLERSTIEVNERVRLVAGDEALDTELQITEAGIRHVMALLRKRFNYLVVDMPVPMVPALHPVIAMARHVIVLMEAEVTGLRNAQALRTMVANIAGKNRTFLMLNRCNRAGGLALTAITKGLGAPPDMLIPDLGKGMTEAVNLGIPAVQRLAALRKHLAPVVREIAGITTEKKWLRKWWFQ